METFAGFAIAMVVGLTGIGGGMLTVPVLILVFHRSPAEAVGTATIFTVLVRLMAAPTYMIRRQVDYRAAGMLLLGGLPGAVAGVRLHEYFRGTNLQPAVLIAVGLTVAILASASLFHWTRNGHDVSSGANRRKWLAVVGLPIGANVGFSSSGAGGLGNLALLNCTANPPVKVVGTDLLFGVLLAAAAGSLHLVSGNVNPGLLLSLCVGGVPGALAGALAASYLPVKQFRTGLAVFLIYLGLHLIWNGVQGFGK